MKKLLVIGIMLILIISLIGCENSTTSNNQDTEGFIGKVDQVEQNQYELSVLKISYEDFVTSLENTISEDYLNTYEQESLFAIDGKEYKVSDIKGLSKEELDNLKIKVEDIREKIGLSNPDITIDISESYDADIKDWKYVFAKTTQEDNNESNTGMITTKRYTFEKKDDTWKIISVESDMLPYSQDKIELKDELLPKLKYQTVNNEQVEYKESYDYSDILN